MQFSVEEYEFIKSFEKPNMGIFSQKEINSMEKVLNTFSHLTSEEITQSSHKEEAWTKPKNKEIKSPSIKIILSQGQTL